MIFILVDFAHYQAHVRNPFVSPGVEHPEAHGAVLLLFVPILPNRLAELLSLQLQQREWGIERWDVARIDKLIKGTGCL